MSDESVKRIQASLLRLKTQHTDPLENMLASIFQSQAPEVVELARSCSIPRWFDTELIAALANEPVTAGHAEAILEKINDWEFVQTLGNGRFAYRREIRDHLRLEVQRKSPDRFFLLNHRAHSHFNNKLPADHKINEMSWSQLDGESISALREKIYHLLQIDFEAAFDMFQILFRGAHRLYLIGEASALLKFVMDLNTTNWNENTRNLVDYYKAMQQNADGDRESAEVKLNDLKIRSIPDNLKVQVLTLLGSIYFVTKRLDPAIVVFQEAQKISNSMNLVRQNAVLSNNLGNAYLAKNDLVNAEKHFQQAFVHFQKIGRSEQAQVLNNLGTVRLRQERRSEAFDFLEKSLALKSQIGDQFGAAITQENIGILYQQISADSYNTKTSNENRGKALEYYIKSLETFRLMGAVSNQAKVLYRLANFYHQAQEDNKAKEFLRESLLLYKSVGLKKELENSAPLAKTLGLQI
jgi:tetratricopeptide (TPR) repeat protein